MTNDSTAATVASEVNTDTTVSTASLQTEDPYIWLEDVEGKDALDFAKASNEHCLSELGDPEKSDGTSSSSYHRILAVLESDERIPGVSQYGINGNDRILINFWKDSKNPKGLWRQTTYESYSKIDSKTEWKTILDVDKLAEKDGISWVWGGATTLARARDNNSKMVTRALLNLSPGGSDAVHIREFDLTTTDFVTDNPFHIDYEAKTSISYKSRDIVWVGSNFGPDSLTDSGYPRTVREWVRGKSSLEDARTIFEGEKQDVSVGMYIVDERVWNGGIYEVRYRSLTFYTKKLWVRKIDPSQLVSPTEESPEFIAVNIPDDAEMSFVGKMLIISLRTDWKPNEKTTYKQGSVIITDADNFFLNGPTKSTFEVLFEPTDRTAYEYYTVTKNFLILSTMENVKSRLQFYRIINGEKLEPIGSNNAQSEALIRDCSVCPVDPYLGFDEFWYETSDFTTPTTLYLADANTVDEFSNFETGDPIKSLPPQYNADNLIVEQRIATSKDGTEIPYFIILHKDTVLDGSNPTLLYGYGGFEVSLTPHYIAAAGIAWLERGGVYVEANIRGGGEFGPSWHQSALRDKRNKCYEDFAAVAEHLIAGKICTAKTLAARGGSNGGLLMGNMYTKYPHLFGAIHCAVPLLDMQRYHTLLAGASWMAEYGNPDTDDWDFLKEYSPYHNIDPSGNYPPILVTTSTRDDRVHPAHARKFVKKLRDTNPTWKVYYFENIEGGHGGAANAKQSAFMLSLAYDFMFDTLLKNKQQLPN